MLSNVEAQGRRRRPRRTTLYPQAILTATSQGDEGRFTKMQSLGLGIKKLDYIA